MGVFFSNQASVSFFTSLSKEGEGTVSLDVKTNAVLAPKPSSRFKLYSGVEVQATNEFQEAKLHRVFLARPQAFNSFLTFGLQEQAFLYRYDGLRSGLWPNVSLLGEHFRAHGLVDHGFSIGSLGSSVFKESNIDFLLTQEASTVWRVDLRGKSDLALYGSTSPFSSEVFKMELLIATQKINLKRDFVAVLGAKISLDELLRPCHQLGVQGAVFVDPELSQYAVTVENTNKVFGAGVEFEYGYDFGRGKEGFEVKGAGVRATYLRPNSHKLAVYSRAIEPGVWFTFDNIDLHASILLVGQNSQDMPKHFSLAGSKLDLKLSLVF